MSPSRDDLLKHLPGLRRYARLLAGDAFLADDLVQDTLERACRSEHLWPGRERLRAWMLSVMHNLFVSEMRARRDYAGEVPDELADPVDRAHAADVRLDLAAGLRRLSPAHREVLLLVCVEDCSYDDAARILDVPVGTVMSRLSRARAQLRASMEGTPHPAQALRRIK